MHDDERDGAADNKGTPRRVVRRDVEEEIIECSDIAQSEEEQDEDVLKQLDDGVSF